jgi:hypothetical protein
MSNLCIVVFDDEQGICAPFGWDEDCEGAICCSSKPVVFANRRLARQAITVSRRWAALRKAQGQTSNADFEPGCSDSIKVLSVDLKGDL